MTPIAENTTVHRTRMIPLCHQFGVHQDETHPESLSAAPPPRQVLKT